MILFLGLKLLGLVLAVILGYVEIQVPSNQYIHHLGVIHNNFCRSRKYKFITIHPYYNTND